MYISKIFNGSNRVNPQITVNAEVQIMIVAYTILHVQVLNVFN